MNPQPKPAPRLLVNRRTHLALKAQYRELRARVSQRDGGKCRICHKPAFEAHHIEFRSRGGTDTMANLVLLCRQHHTDVHGHVLKLAGTAQGRKGLRVGEWSETLNDYKWRAV